MLEFFFEILLLGFLIVVLLVYSNANIKTIYQFAYLLLVLHLGLYIYIYIHYKVRAFNFYTIENLGFSTSIFNVQMKFGIDGLSFYFIFLTILLTLLSIIYIKEEKEMKFYIINILILEFLLILIFSTLDLFLFYICFETLLIPMYLMIGVWGSRNRKIWASYLLFFYTFCSSILLLLGLLYIFLKTGIYEINILSVFTFSFTEQYWLWIIFFLAFGAKVPVFPFHIWLPEAHVEASTIGSVFLAGILLKLGTYGFCRFNLILFPIANIFFIPLIFTLCCLGVIFGSFSAIRQTDLKRIIAYSSVAHMNFIVLGIFSLNVLALEGSIYQSISHGFVTSSLFFLIGILYRRYHVRSIFYYSGLVQIMPIYITIFFLCSLANMAFPLTSSFIGELLLFLGIFQIDIRVVFICAFSIVLCGSYSLWLMNRFAFGGLNNILLKNTSDLTLKEFMAIVPLLVLIFFSGLYPNLILDIFQGFVYKILLQNFLVL